MALLNQKCFPSQSLSCSFVACNELIVEKCFSSLSLSFKIIHANGLVEICSTSISHNFGLEGPIPTSQAFLCSL